MKTRISLEPTELDEDEAHTRCEVREACISVERTELPPDPEWLASQDLFLSPEEMQALYHRMRLYYEQGIWSTGTVEW
jgi:hypothetical protein